MSLILFNFESNKNSQALAFALDWVNEIAKNVDKLYVVSLRCGEYEVGENVEVFCLGQDKKNKIETIWSIFKTLTLIHKKDKNIQGYFVHMAHYFVPFIYPFSLFFRKKIILWYAHKSTPLTLKLAVLLVDKIVSISSKSMLLKTDKFQAIGHGIDTTKRFIFKKKFSKDIKNIVTVGRISKVKNTYEIVKAFLDLKRDDLLLYIVGDILGEDDKRYLQKIQQIISSSSQNKVVFTGKIPFHEIKGIYEEVDLAINLGDGALDKAIIEPMAMGIPVITSNDSAKEIFSHLDGKGVFLTKKEGVKQTLQKVLEQKNFDRELLRQEIVQNHSLKKLAKRIVDEF